MSVFSIMPIEAFIDDRLSKTDLRVLGAIVSYSNKETGICWPKREQIAARCGLPLCKISTSTTRLVELGWLSKDGDGGRSRSASYKVLTPVLSPKTVTDSVTVTKSETVTDSVTKTVTDSVTVTKSETVTDSVTKTVTDSVRGIKQTIEQTIGESKRASEKVKGGFDNFWSAYPKKKSKDDARKAWKKINPDEQLLQTIIDAVTMAKTQDFDWIKDDGQFIPFPATYLNGKRWEDEIKQKSQGDLSKSYPGSTQSRQQRGNYGEYIIPSEVWNDTNF